MSFNASKCSEIYALLHLSLSLSLSLWLELNHIKASLCIKYLSTIRKYKKVYPFQPLAFAVLVLYQWRIYSNALRGPRSTVTWGPYPFPSLSLHFLLSPSLPFPCLSFPSLSPLFPSPFLRSRPLLIQLGGLESAVSSPAGSGAEPQSKLNLEHFSFII